MSQYRVFGTVAGVKVDKCVEAIDGAEAIKSVVQPHYPKFGKQWQRERKEWADKEVRLNATQLDPIAAGHTPKPNAPEPPLPQPTTRKPLADKCWVVYNQHAQEYVCWETGVGYSWTRSPASALRFTWRDASYFKISRTERIRKHLRSIHIDNLPEYHA